jgi:uncharacterized phage protein (TIGR01671 family)
MNREILFRGKRVDNGEWINGFFGIKGKDTEYERIYIMIDTLDVNHDFTYFYLTDIEVVPETIGQFTGLFDKNGKRIFEGDILRFPATSQYEETTYNAFEVFFHDNDCCDKHIGWQCNRMHPQGNSAGGSEYWNMIPKHTKQLIVIGNIHDNPDLLK